MSFSSYEGAGRRGTLGASGSGRVRGLIHELSFQLLVAISAVLWLSFS